ncbi:MAG TPA: NIPSNAP family protein [Thermoanaerobaculia bacterium]|nr:NIPSNAP family protein [Thermoanaerobaculia bacterium]
MRRSVLAILLLLASTLGSAPAASGEERRAFELRVYTAEQDKMEALEQRFRDHTLRLFVKHGMEVVGFWKPVAEEGQEGKLVYLLAFPSHQARSDAWSAFGKDPEWQKVYAESHQDGPLVKKIESTRLDPTDYSPLR